MPHSVLHRFYAPGCKIQYRFFDEKKMAPVVSFIWKEKSPIIEKLVTSKVTLLNAPCDHGLAQGQRSHLGGQTFNTTTNTFLNFVFEVIENSLQQYNSCYVSKTTSCIFIFKLLAEKSLHIFVGYCVESLYVYTMIRSEYHQACPSPRAVFFSFILKTFRIQSF